MTKRMIAPIIFGIVGIAILVMLGNWQMDRLVWKEAVLAEMDARLSAAGVAVPALPDATRDLYLSVSVTGTMEEGEIHVLSSSPETGPGYRIIVPFTLNDGRRILIDRGVVPEGKKANARPLESGTLEGNLLWMQEDAVFEPNLDRNIWFSRDPVALSAALNTEPVLMVMRKTSVSGAPFPVSIGLNIPNSHLGYALTWYGFALVWLTMTLYLLIRIKRKTV